MSFGFSVGDFIAVGKLVKEISSSLQDVGGAKSEYQELLRELECLKQALQHLDKLHNAGPSSPTLDSIKYAALSCQSPLEQFLGKVRNYDKSLGVWGTGGLFKGTVDKVRWGLGQKEEVRKLQSYLNVHVGTINLLLAEFGLEKMDIALDQADKQHGQVKETLNSTRSMIGTISSRVVAQEAVQQSTKTMLARLCEFINGDFRTSWKSLGQTVAKICVSTQQSYTLLLEIRSSLVGPDTRWTYFQLPLVVEDAFGCKFPVPSEYDFNLLDAIVRTKFDTGPGSLDVQAGNYEYFKTKNSADVLSKTSRLLPGTAITMAVVIVGPTLTDETCPMPKCRSNQTSACSGGGRTCCECHVWFSPTKKRRRTLEDDALPDSSIHDFLTEARPIESVETPRKRHKAAPEKEAGNTYKNVRLSNAVIPKSPLLQAVKPRATPTPSPPPEGTHHVTILSNAQNVSPPSSRRRKKPNRQKTRPSQGDLVLIRVMDPNRPVIARQVGERELNPDSGSEADDEEIEYLPQTRESHLQEPPTVPLAFYGRASNRFSLSGL